MDAKPKPRPDDGIGALSAISAIVLASGAVFVLSNARVGRCAGARRSVRLEFEQRQKAMQAAAEAQHAIAAPTPASAVVATPPPAVDSHD